MARENQFPEDLGELCRAIAGRYSSELNRAMVGTIVDQDDLEQDLRCYVLEKGLHLEWARGETSLVARCLWNRAVDQWRKIKMRTSHRLVLDDERTSRSDEWGGDDHGHGYSENGHRDVFGADSRFQDPEESWTITEILSLFKRGSDEWKLVAVKAYMTNTLPEDLIPEVLGMVKSLKKFTNSEIAKEIFATDVSYTKFKTIQSAVRSRIAAYLNESR